MRAPNAATPVANITTRFQIKSSQRFSQRYQFRRMASSNSSESTHEKALAALARLSRRVPPRNPSKRTPDQGFRNNVADRIKKAQQEAGLHTWGFSIYRCTYESDADWAEFLHRYQWHVNHLLGYYNGLDMLKSYQVTVFKDKSLFEGATTATIRDYFQK